MRSLGFRVPNRKPRISSLKSPPVQSPPEPTRQLMPTTRRRFGCPHLLAPGDQLPAHVISGYLLFAVRLPATNGSVLTARCSNTVWPATLASLGSTGPTLILISPEAACQQKSYLAIRCGALSRCPSDSKSHQPSVLPRPTVPSGLMDHPALRAALIVPPIRDSHPIEMPHTLCRGDHQTNGPARFLTKQYVSPVRHPPFRSNRAIEVPSGHNRPGPTCEAASRYVVPPSRPIRGFGTVPKSEKRLGPIAWPKPHLVRSQ